MRVLLVTDSFPPVVDGIATSVLALATGLCDLGHDVLVVAPRRPGARHRGGQVVELPSIALPRVSYPLVFVSARRYARIADAFAADVVHVHTLAVLGMTASLHSNARRLPNVFTWHTDVMEYRKAYPLLHLVIPLVHLCWASQGGRVGAFRDVVAMVIRRLAGRDVSSEQERMLAVAVDRHHRVVAPSAKAARRVPVLGHRTVDVVPTGVIHQEWDEVRNLPFPPTGGKVVAFVGRPSAEKNFVGLLEAMRAQVLPEHPDAVLAVVGPVLDPRAMRRILAAAGMSDAVRLTGPLPNELIVQFLRRCAVLALPSTTETQGVVLTEAAVAGCPAVVVDDRLDGIVRHGHTGLVTGSMAEFGRALSRLLGDTSLRDRLGDAARSAAAGYTHRDMADRMLAIYESAAAERGRSQA